MEYLFIILAVVIGFVIAIIDPEYIDDNRVGSEFNRPWDWH